MTGIRKPLSKASEIPDAPAVTRLVEPLTDLPLITLGYNFEPLYLYLFIQVVF